MVHSHLLEEVGFELNWMVIWNLGRWRGDDGGVGHVCIVCMCVSFVGVGTGEVLGVPNNL